MTDPWKVGDPIKSMKDMDKFTAAEQTRMDDQGNLVVTGLSWSEAATNVYLAFFLSAQKPSLLLPVESLGLIQKEFRRGWASLSVTHGKPTWSDSGFGACLELPSDLAEDPIKTIYVGEWLSTTALEAWEQRGVNPASIPHKFTVWLYEAAMKVTAGSDKI